jgi:glycogen(starch) synthase
MSTDVMVSRYPRPINPELPECRGYRVLHIVDESLPLISGYAIRTDGLTQAQMVLGNKPVVLTGPTHQLRDANAKDTAINGVSYIRTPTPVGLPHRAIQRRWPVARELSIVKTFRQSTFETLNSQQFDVVHAHSPVLNGLAALQAARARKIPFVYEIRAFWEDAAVNQAKTTIGSPRYFVTRQLEQYVVNQADAVVGIARSILDELRSRGVEEQKLFHVPNGVDTIKFQPIPRNQALTAKFGIGDVPVLGFIGSLFYFEGISWLVRAAVELYRRGARFKLLIAGHGEDADAIRKVIVDSNAHDYVLFVGKVLHDEVRNYYSLIDIMVYPRRSIRLTELVTPLKPLEAMAMRIAVLGSSVGGICELVEDENTGLLFAPENTDEFCSQAERLIDDVAFRNRIAEQGRQMVLQQKVWTTIASRYHEVYEYAAESAAGR